MTKQALIDGVVADTGLSKAKALEAIDSVFKRVHEALVADGEATFVGFGRFEVIERAARTGRNPKTGEEIEIAASRAVKFRAGKALKEAVNK